MSLNCSEIIVDHSNQMVQETLLELQELLRSGRPKTVYFEAMLQAIETNQAINTQRVSGELSILQINVVHYLYDFSKSSHDQNIAKFFTHPSIF